MSKKNDEAPTPGLDARNALITTAMAVGAGAAAGGSPTVAGASGAATIAMNAFYGLREKWAHRRVSSAAWAVEQAAEIVGGLAILEERAASDDDRIELTAKVLEAAAQTTMPAKIRALAQVLAGGLEEGGDVDEATVLALALKDLEGAHIEVLRVMTVSREVEGIQPEVMSAEDWQLGELRERSGVRVFEAILAVLIRHGLMTDFHERSSWATIEAARWNLTGVGRKCLELLGHDPFPDVTAG